MARITPDSIVCQSQNQISTQIDGEVVLLSVEKGVYFAMNKVLSRMWETIESPVSVSQICETLQQKYDVPPEVCSREVMEILEKLAANELISIA